MKVLTAESGLPIRESWGWFGPYSIFIQPAAIAVAFDSSVKTLIYLGDAHYLCTWVGAAIGRVLGKRVLFWTHGYTKRDRGVKHVIRRMFYRIPHELLLYGHRGESLAVEAGIPRSRLKVIYNSLDYDLHKGMRLRYKSADLAIIRKGFFEDSKKPIILFSARLTARKDFALGIRAISILQDEGHPLQLLVIGDGPERKNLEGLCAQLKVPSVFLGAVYDEEQLAKCFLASAVVVSPGEVGLTAIHALAYGRPVVTHDDFEMQGPEVEVISDGLTGAFFERGNCEELARSIRRLTQSASPCSGTVDACIKMVETSYTPDAQAAAILGFANR